MGRVLNVTHLPFRLIFNIQIAFDNDTICNIFEQWNYEYI